MKLFKTHSRYSDREKASVFSKHIDGLNYVPVSYVITDDFNRFLTGFEKEYRRFTDHAPEGSLVYDAFLARIQAEVNSEISRTKEQYEKHVEFINHLHGIIKGDEDRLQEKITALTEEKQIYRQTIDKYLKLKSELESDWKEE